MATMSYCAFENTVADLRICVENIQDAIDQGYADWSEYEQNNLPDLIETAQKLIDKYEKMERKNIKWIEDMTDEEVAELE
jgi:hypothetical protein